MVLNRQGLNNPVNRCECLRRKALCVFLKIANHLFWKAEAREKPSLLELESEIGGVEESGFK